jgi:hypothetical protein
MNSPHDLSDNFIVDSTEIGRGRSPLIKIISVAAAVALTAGLLIGVLIWRKWHVEKTGVAQQSQSETARPAPPTPPAKVQVFMDEPVRKGSQAIISGTIHNLSNENLSNITVEVELSHRKETSTEMRSLEVEPKELGPDQDGRYSVTLTGDYRSIKLLRIKSGAKSEEIGFKTAPGAKRPVERAPETRTVIINRPSKPSKGEDFINTPDNPARIP